MKIVVIAETYQQFKLYVTAVICKRAVVKEYLVCPRIVSEQIEYIFVDTPRKMMGYTFSENDELVKVGSWYNLPQAERIEDEFKSRVKK